LALAGIGYAIYEVTKKTDDNLDDLIDRIKALDPIDENAKGFLKQVIETLGAYKPYLGLSKISTDPVERAKINKQKLDAISHLVSYLKELQRRWPEIETYTTDLGWDKSQAKNALDKTILSIEQNMSAIKSMAKKETQIFLDQLEKDKGHNYRVIAKNVVDTYNKLVKETGKVSFDNPAEEAGFKLAQDILSGSAGIEQIDSYGLSMIHLNNLLQQASSKLQGKKAYKSKPLLSKRALTLGDGTKVTTKGDQGVAGKRPISKRVGAHKLQTIINQLSAIYSPESQRLNVDGIYGKNTSAALFSLTKKIPNLSKIIATYAGISINSLQDYDYMAKEPQLLDKLTKIMESVFVCVCSIYVVYVREWKHSLPKIKNFVKNLITG
jgi:DNA repair exonuclease SbcCD ATPase subunit